MKPRDYVAQGQRIGQIMQLSRKHRLARVAWHDARYDDKGFQALEYENTADLEVITKKEYERQVHDRTRDL